MDEQIKEKIRKLLSLAGEGNDNSNESYEAFTKAQELLARYKLNLSDIKEKKPQNIIELKTGASYGTRSSDHYMTSLAAIIADNFCCATYVSTAYRSRTHYICFIGEEDDVLMAEAAFMKANVEIIRGCDKVYRNMMRIYFLNYIPAAFWNPAKLGYVRGYLDGLKRSFEKQMENHEEWSLVLTVPQEVKDFINGLDIRNDSGSYCGIDLTYYGKGYNDGEGFNMNKCLNC